MGLDHFVINVDQKYQKDIKIIKSIENNGFPYKPSWGKGTKGFKASNLWIGNEYFEMIHILKKDGGGWKSEWVDYYNNGHRGLICIMIDTDNLDKLCETLVKKDIKITSPTFLQFKWFFNLLTRTMPWRNSYLPFFEGIPLQIGFQQMKDNKAREFMEQYMVPNSRDNQINGIKNVIVRGPYTPKDLKLIKAVFSNYDEDEGNITMNFSTNQKLIFQNNECYGVEIITECKNKLYIDKTIQIENIMLYNTNEWE